LSVDKKLYESYIILDGNLEDASIDEVVLKYENYFKKNNVKIRNTELIGRRRMAYAMKKKQNGFYICFEYDAKPQFISKLERTFKLDEGILRYLTIFISPRTYKEKDEYFKKKALMIAKIESELKTETKPEEVVEEIPAIPEENNIIEEKL
jgi:small subunit ribosomal protein S6